MVDNVMEEIEYREKLGFDPVWLKGHHSVSSFARLVKARCGPLLGTTSHLVNTLAGRRRQGRMARRNRPLVSFWKRQLRWRGPAGDTSTARLYPKRPSDGPGWLSPLGEPVRVAVAGDRWRSCGSGNSAGIVMSFCVERHPTTAGMPAAYPRTLEKQGRHSVLLCNGVPSRIHGETGSLRCKEMLDWKTLTTGRKGAALKSTVRRPAVPRGHQNPITCFHIQEAPADQKRRNYGRKETLHPR